MVGPRFLTGRVPYLMPSRHKMKKQFTLCVQPNVIISTKEVMFSSALVCLLAGLCKNCSTSFHRIWWKVLRGPWKKILDFGGNLNRAMLRLRLGGGTAVLRVQECRPAFV